MGRMRVSCADSCGSHLVHISHHRCWLEEFTLAPRLHRPFCDPCLLPSQSCSSLQILSHPSPEVSSPSPGWQPFSGDTHPTSHLSHPPSHTALGPGIFWDLWPPNPLHFLLPPKFPKLDPHLQHPQLPRLSTTCKVPPWASLQLLTAPCPPPQSPVGPCWVFTNTAVTYC